MLRLLCDRFQQLSDWKAEPVHEVVHAVAEERGVGLGKVAQPIRVAVAGESVSPPIDLTLSILGREETVARLDRAIAFIQNNTP